jgi:hypothetical protein
MKRQRSRHAFRSYRVRNSVRPLKYFVISVSPTGKNWDIASIHHSSYSLDHQQRREVGNKKHRPDRNPKKAPNSSIIRARCSRLNDACLSASVAPHSRNSALLEEQTVSGANLRVPSSNLSRPILTSVVFAANP